MAPSPQPLNANQRLSEFAARVVSQRAQRLAFLVQKAAKSPSEDLVHRLRVAARRLCSSLEAFEAHFPAKAASRVGKKATHLRNAAGQVRDLDIAVALPREIGFELSEKALGRINKRRGNVSDELRRRLERLNRKSPGGEWARALHLSKKGGQPAPGPLAATYSAALLPDMANDFFEAGYEAAAPAATIESLHAFRILGKRFRYTLEIFSPCYGEDLEDALQLLRGLQEVLGMVNDCETAAEILKKAVGRNRRAEVQEMLEQRQAALIATFRSHWQETFAADDERRVWMRMLAKPAFAPASETADDLSQAAVS